MPPAAASSNSINALSSPADTPSPRSISIPAVPEGSVIPGPASPSFRVIRLSVITRLVVSTVVNVPDTVKFPATTTGSVTVSPSVIVPPLAPWLRHF